MQSSSVKDITPPALHFHHSDQLDYSLAAFSSSDFACKPGADTDLAGNKMAQSEDGGEESSVKGKGKNPTMLRRRVPKMLLHS